MAARMQAVGEPGRTYIPAAGHDRLLPLYDPIAGLLGLDAARRTLLEQAAIRSGHRVLDIGCGTGSLILQIKRNQPEVDLVGLDPDPKALARAGRKVERAGASVRLDRGFSDALPYSDASFDRVLSSFMFHHLGEDEQEKTLHEVRRVLTPGGRFHMVDFRGLEPNGKGFLVRLLHSGHALHDTSERRILSLMDQAGLADPGKVGDGALLFGLRPLAYYQAAVSAS